jgi:Na+-driven multidrug efflux pump
MALIGHQRRCPEGFEYGGGTYGALGDSVTPQYMLILSTVLNIVLDLLFVRVFHWGIAGVSWATVIAQGISCISSLWYLNRYHPLLKTDFRRLKLDRVILKQSLRIGLPSGV